MIQQNSLNVKLSNSQLNKLKFAIKNKTEKVLLLSSTMTSDDQINFPHKLLLVNRQVSNLRKAFANKLSTDIKSSKTQSSQMIQSGGFLGRLLVLLLNINQDFYSMILGTPGEQCEMERAGTDFSPTWDTFKKYIY